MYVEQYNEHVHEIHKSSIQNRDRDYYQYLKAHSIKNLYCPISISLIRCAPRIMAR